MNMHNPIVSAGRAHIAGEATAYAQYIVAKLLARDTGRTVTEIFASRYPSSAHLDVVRKTAISAGTLTGWGGPLAPAAPLASAFLAYLRPRTIIGKLAASCRVVPLNITVARAVSGTTAYWVGEGRPTPLSAMAFDGVALPPAKIGGIVCITRELAKSSDPDAAILIRDDLANAVTALADTAFVDPANAGTAGISPASITRGAPSVVSSGATADAFAKDFTALVALITTGMVAPFVIMRPTMAIALAGLNIPLTADAGLDGDLADIPIITSVSAPANTIVLIDAAAILLAQGPLELDASDATSLEFAAPPTDPVTAATVLISLFQANLFAIRAVEFVNWLSARPGAVALLTGLTYGP